MLTPLDLNGKTFSKGFRGYDTDEVNQFFSQISRDYERLYQDNVELKDSVERVSAKLEYYQRMESTMQSTLVVAQETADEVKKSSQQKAQVLTRETELACNKQKEAAVSFCNKLRADTEAEITRMKSEADAYAEKVRKMADEYASKTRSEADDYGKSTRTDADSYALGIRSKTDSSTSKLREETQSFVDKMKSMAEIEVARMKVETEDSCKSQLADSREQARTLTAEATAHANQVMAEANQQSQNIVAEATQKSHEMIANAQKQSQDMMAEANQKSQTMITEATQKSQRMVAEATEQSRSLIREATDRSNKMVFVAEAKAAAAMDTYNTMVTKANSQSKQFKSLLQSQLSLYDNFDAEYTVDQMVQSKLNAVRKAEPVLETKAEPVVAGTDDAVMTVAEAKNTELEKAAVIAADSESVAEGSSVAAVETEKTVSVGEFATDFSKQRVVESDTIKEQEGRVNNVTAKMPVTENVAEVSEENAAVPTGKKEPTEVNFTEAANADPVMAASENANQNEGDKYPEEESNGYGSIRKPLFSRFNPRGHMVFNRNGFPRKNADLRVALSELQKSTEPRFQSEEAKSESAGEAVTPEVQNAILEPEENKES